MRRFPLFVIDFCLLTGCTKPRSSEPAVAEVPGSTLAPAEPSASSDDPVQIRLVELAGSSATNCGVFKSSVLAELNSGSQCAENAFKTRTPFYIEYQMAGLTVVVAGNSQASLFRAVGQRWRGTDERGVSSRTAGSVQRTRHMLCERRISGPRSGLKPEPARRFGRNADWTSEIDITGQRHAPHLGKKYSSGSESSESKNS